MWEFEHLTSRPCNPKSNAKSESAIRNSKNLLRKVLDNIPLFPVGAVGILVEWIAPYDASTWQFWTIEMHRGIMARCCQPFVHSTGACDTVVNRGIRFHVETLHIIPFEACSTSVIFLLGRCFPLVAFPCLSLGQSLFSSRFSRYFGLLVTTAGSGIVVPKQCPISSVPCYLPTIADKWSLLSLPETRAYGASVVLLGLTLPDV